MKFFRPKNNTYVRWFNTNPFKGFNFSLFAVLIIMSLLPTIYTTVRIYFLGNVASDYGYNLASQLTWVNVIVEVIQEALVLPLFYLIGSSLNKKEELENKIRTGLLFSFTVYAIFATAIFLLAKPLLIFMAQKKELIDISEKYIRLETVAILVSILYKFVSIILISLKNNKTLLVLLCFQMTATIFCDIFLISPYAFSLNLGVMGIALTNIIVNTALFIVGLLLLKRENLLILKRSTLSFGWLKSWLKIGSFSGLESLIRNFVFIVVILKMINLVQEQGNFWLANNFIWGWLLMPILALGELIKRNTAENPENTPNHLFSYFVVTSLIVVLWVATIPFWNIFIHKMMNIKDAGVIVQISITSIVFYILFAYNNIVDNIFYGLGRTDLMLIQSMAINILFYGTIMILFNLDLFIPTLKKITIMFGIGMALDSILTFLIFWYIRKTTNLFRSSHI